MACRTDTMPATSSTSADHDELQDEEPAGKRAGTEPVPPPRSRTSAPLPVSSVTACSVGHFERDQNDHKLR